MSSSSKDTSIRKSMITGSIWMIAMRWSIRGIGLFSTMILARLLMPEDFGIIAMAALVVRLLEVLASFGVDLALIRNQNATREHYDTAWTFKFLQNLVIGLLIIAFSPLISDYFEEPKIIPVLIILAISSIISGLTNIGVVAFRKELDFKKEFQFGVFKKIAGFCVTIPCAFLIQSYWALLIGICFGQLVSVILSYMMHPYRPKLCLKKARELWAFSQWMLVINFASNLKDSLDQLIVGGLMSTSKMGTYSISNELATLPTVELVQPMSRALFPGYAKLLHDPHRLTSAFLRVLGVIAALSIPISIGMALVANDVVMIILGEKWADVVPLLKFLSVYGAVIVLAGNMGNLLVALGHLKTTAAVNWIYLISLAPALYWSGAYYGLIGVVEAKMWTSLLYFSMYVIALIKFLPLSLVDILKVLYRPAISASVMAYVLSSYSLDLGLPIFSLVLDVLVGGIVHVGTSYILWVLSKKPNGPESLAIEFVQKKLKR